MLQMVNPLTELTHPAPAWGIDPGTKKFVITIIPPDGSGDFDTRVIDMPVASETRRLAVGHERLCVGFASALADYGFPAWVNLEQPFARGRNVHPQSFYFVGVGLAALGLVLGLEAQVDTPGPTEWKKPALGAGRGNAKKPEILAWARDLGLLDQCEHCRAVNQVDEKQGCKKQGLAHDKADSLGLAVAAARSAMLA